ncbi:aspartate aminotransferase family protein [Bacillus sp. FJAT-45350]|uniref:aspartate aminotransferase family protein n=1 Tax=Bacillus sp. FJAT-45350 TaxID=2011014 RepID=UPI000BB682BE|nr:aspartate aminotransferase family protein [Bacillus sp. FJAT-45350]
MAIRKVEHPILKFMERTKMSRQFMEKAKEVMPGGVTANIKYFAPYPIVMKKGNGAYVTDVDGNEYIDYLLSYGALMLGHGHKEITEAVKDQLDQDGTCLFGTPHQLEYEMGKKLQEHYPSLELLRYTNSGTEATLLSLRLAAAYTGKHKIAKFEGHYHGGYDQVLLSVNPPVQEAGPSEKPNAVIESRGVDPNQLDNTIILPFNDFEACENILKENQNDIGALVLEPVQGGFIPAEQEFMDGIGKLTKELGIVLIFDEVKTGYRLGLGGAQEIYNITPDLTTLGKVIGGGYPIGVVGGKREIMMVSAPSVASDVFDSSQSKKSSAKDVLFHSGTYNGHPTILAAGLATIKVLERESEKVFDVTNILKSRLEKLFKSKGIPMKAVGIGSIFSVVLTNKDKIRNYRDLQETDLVTRKEMDIYLLNEGIYTKPLNRYSVSTAHSLKEVELTVAAYERVLTKMFGGSRF